MEEEVMECASCLIVYQERQAFLRFCTSDRAPLFEDISVVTHPLAGRALAFLCLSNHAMAFVYFYYLGVTFT